MEWGGLDLFVICVEGAQTDKTLLLPPLVLCCHISVKHETEDVSVFPHQQPKLVQFVAP